MKFMSRILVAVAVAAPLLAADSSYDSNRAILSHCQVLLIHDVDVPAEEAGRLLAVNAKEGDHVEKDSLVAQINNKQALLSKVAAELERDAAQTRADDDIEVRYSIKSFELAEAELNQDVEINRRSPGTVPTTEIRRKQLDRTRAELQIDRSRLDLKVAQMTADVQNAAVQAAEDSIQRRRIVAPFSGQVVQVYRQSNEWVDIGEPVLRVVQMDRLYVDGFISGTDYNVVDIADRPVTIEIALARGRKETFKGRVVFVNPIVQAGNRYRVRAEVENRQEKNQWLLNPGSTATMVIHLQ
ncbi:MAG: HlyD family efflux transporter periplasmic adaptor subunit [Planctomycetaceae bacterium]|nr:HlyD family efflux transporter periplasmic adaptor subunit [Planctomycetales bacterium]MCB9921590.1 HlyD family efflux transporter periplasmic adaptor subunit [Planctomycetaceae bacterium]